MRSSIFNRPSVAFLFSLLCGASVWAHPGHDLLDHGPSHLLISPYHLAFLALIAFVLMGSTLVISKTRAKLALRWSGAALLLATGVLWTLSH